MALLISLFYPRMIRMKTNPLFLNPQIAQIHTDFLRAVLLSVICEDLRKSVNNPSRHDGPGCPISLRRSRFRLQRFRFAIPRRRIGDQRFKKMMRGMGYVIDRAIECFFVCARWLCKSGKLPNKLERRSANLVIRRWWRKIMQGLDSSAHL